LSEDDDPLRELERDAGMGGTGGKSSLFLLKLPVKALAVVEVVVAAAAAAVVFPFIWEEAADDEGTSAAKDKARLPLSGAPEYVLARFGSGGEPEEEPEDAAERLDVALTFATGLGGRLRMVLAVGVATGSAFFFLPNHRKPIAPRDLERRELGVGERERER
jgi:hypothetical protein